METINRFSDDCLPPEGTYNSREELYAAINDWAAPRGYTFVDNYPQGNLYAIFPLPDTIWLLYNLYRLPLRRKINSLASCYLLRVCKEGPS